jgi:penicillin amidase
MNRTSGILCSLLLVFNAGLLPSRAADEATLYRDEFGIPHIYAATLESAAYAAGYAQAEDRLEELLKNYRRASGTMSEVFGPDYFHQDVVQRLFRHAEISRDKYSSLRPKTRG